MKALLAAALLCAATAPAFAQTGPVVAVEGGEVGGTTLPGGRFAFRGIPYAAPPVGPLRWRPPAPVRPWRGIRPAAVRAPACPQMDDGWNKAEANHWSEDCLILDVSTASLSAAAHMPVFVWIHGGSNKAGSAGDTITSSMSAKGVVLVSIQYRLGALGFMAHPALSAEAPWRASGNWGIQDQQAALRWVRRNIARFGGDPARVTIGGESAGAQDVGLQTLSPGARGLYVHAIEESGTAGFGFPARDLATSEHYGTLIAAAAGAATQTPAALRALPVAAILRAERQVQYPGLVENGTVWLQATVDGHVLPADPRRLYAEGRVNPGAVLMGSNAQEIGFFDSRPKADAAARRIWGAGVAPVVARYGEGADPRLGTPGMRIGTDFVFRCPTRLVAAQRARFGLPTWTYLFDYDGAGAKVSHASELRTVFAAPGEAGLPASAPPMQAYWLNFIRTGDPNGVGLPNWPRHSVAQPTSIRFGDEGTRAVPAAANDACAGWEWP